MQMRSKTIPAVLAALMLLGGCSSIEVADPVRFENGVYLIAAHSLDVAELKVAMLEKATEFCDDDDLMLHVESLTESSSGASGGSGIPGMIELKFSCRKP